MIRQWGNLSKYLYVYIYILVLIGIYFVYNFHYANPNLNDDKIFATLPLNLEFLIRRYMEWSSRTIIEIFQIAFAHHHYRFLAVNSVALPVLMLAMGWLLGFRSIKNFHFCCLACLLYQFMHMRSAGLISTNVNYFLPATVGFCGLALFRQYLQARRKILFGLSIVLLVAAASAEQLCVAFLILFIAHAIYEYCKNRVLSWPDVIVAFIMLLNIAYILASPGNHNRYECEIVNWFPTWRYLGFFDKIINGLAYIGTYYYSQFNAVGIFFSCALLSAIKPCRLYHLFYFLPLATQVACLASPLPQDNILLFLITLVNLLIYLVSILAADLSNECKWAIAVILGAGFASRMMLSFSPTVFASAYRPFIFMDFSLIAASLLVVRQSLENRGRRIFYLGLLFVLSLANEIQFVRMMIN